jgi:hypothetical protein
MPNRGDLGFGISDCGIRKGELKDKAKIPIPKAAFPIGEDFILAKEVAQW